MIRHSFFFLKTLSDEERSLITLTTFLRGISTIEAENAMVIYNIESK
jgi:hypothetical protein